MAMPGVLRVAGGWYEEDCEWAKVASGFPDLFTDDERCHADRTLRDYYPECWEAVHGRAQSKTTGDGRFKRSVLRLTPAPEWEAGRKGASRSDRERASAGLLQSRSPRTLPMTPSTSVARLAASLPVAPGFAATGQAILAAANPIRSEEHTSELQSLMRISYAVF